MADITNNLHIEGSLFYKSVIVNTPYKYYTINDDELYKPYLIATRNGYPKNYWKIILRTNKVTNPLELKEGQLLIIPTQNEIDLAFSRIGKYL